MNHFNSTDYASLRRPMGTSSPSKYQKSYAEAYQGYQAIQQFTSPNKYSSHTYNPAGGYDGFSRNYNEQKLSHKYSRFGNTEFDLDQKDLSYAKSTMFKPSLHNTSMRVHQRIQAADPFKKDDKSQVKPSSNSITESRSYNRVIDKDYLRPPGSINPNVSKSHSFVNKAQPSNHHMQSPIFNTIDDRKRSQLQPSYGNMKENPTDPLKRLNETIKKIEELKKRQSYTKNFSDLSQSDYKQTTAPSQNTQSLLNNARAKTAKDNSQYLCNTFTYKNMYSKLSPNPKFSNSQTKKNQSAHVRKDSPISQNNTSNEKDIDKEIFSIGQKLKMLENQKKLLQIEQEEISLHAQLEDLKSQKDLNDRSQQINILDYDNKSNMNNSVQPFTHISQQHTPKVNQLFQNTQTFSQKPKETMKLRSSRQRINKDTSYEQDEKIMNQLLNYNNDNAQDHGEPEKSRFSIVKSQTQNFEKSGDKQMDGEDRNELPSSVYQESDDISKSKNDKNEEKPLTTTAFQQLKLLKRNSILVENRALSIYKEHSLLTVFLKQDNKVQKAEESMESDLVDSEGVGNQIGTSNNKNNEPGQIFIQENPNPIQSQILANPIQAVKKDVKSNCKQPKQIPQSQEQSLQTQPQKQFETFTNQMDEMKNEYDQQIQSKKQIDLNNQNQLNEINLDEIQSDLNTGNEMVPSHTNLRSPVYKSPNRIRSKSIQNQGNYNQFKYNLADSMLQRIKTKKLEDKLKNTLNNRDSKSINSNNKALNSLMQMKQWNVAQAKNKTLDAKTNKQVITFHEEEQLNEKEDRIIPSFSKQYNVKKLLMKRMNANWIEWRCDRILEQTHDNKLEKKDHYILMVKEYPFVKNAETGEYHMNPFCIADIEFNIAMMDIEQKLGLQNFSVPEQANIFKNDDKRRVTWVYQMNLKKRYVSCQITSKDPFMQGKYHFNLGETLFDDQEILRKGELVKSIQHGPFYASLLNHPRKANHNRNLLWQVIYKMALILLKYQQAGLVHGNINLESIELMIVQKENEADELVDLRIINQDFSYKYGCNAHTYGKLDQKFMRATLPPEMVTAIKNKFLPVNDQQNDLSKREQPWSHDMWCFGIILVQIIVGCSIHCTQDTVIITKDRKSKIGKGLFALPKTVLTEEVCGSHGLIPTNTCQKKSKKFFNALQSVQQHFLDDNKRVLRKNDHYDLLDDEDLLEIICAMIQEDPKQRISPAQLLNHNYFKKERN